MTTHAVTHPHSIKITDYRAGVISGIVAGLLMAMGGMVLTLIAGVGFFTLPQLISRFVLPEALAFSALGFLVGLTIHMVLSAIYGIGFAVLYSLVTSTYDLISAYGLGLLTGLVLWVVNFYAIGPIFNPALVTGIPVWIVLTGHAVFGLGLGTYLIFRREER